MWRTSSASRVGASAALRGSLWASLVATVMAPVAAIGQQTVEPGGGFRRGPLPEIRVIATTPVAPPRPAQRRPLQLRLRREVRPPSKARRRVPNPA